ncbi:hypothetical protein PUNSTDRAFT_59909 [Punctularia strigosozonata HHB-11173 SS5]|uniref:uncharacterized protein n=1 Tax=Punctularia strigosozonata (strain HHB-11173) TaxID=741275 RepID=UPI0004417CDB|nr:uncharacterized protein PUNSTDRAFT_59909 [Punctularia strigosozonata HHB-11173 SS5]EIN12810.1 hypothetical protein PUNSTDRAFT_59909 [Punctularia strigosozonata HHB-11173 SS5]
MDLDFPGLDADSRKKRRNRTTQSCLNCHTSKRKCDRKRPCSRCIQLGLTGLCIYETSDPNERRALTSPLTLGAPDQPSCRDDPNLPEVERLRGRVAELESLVRELRGQDATFILIYSIVLNVWSCGRQTPPAVGRTAARSRLPVEANALPQAFAQRRSQA